MKKSLRRSLLTLGFVLFFAVLLAVPFSLPVRRAPAQAKGPLPFQTIYAQAKNYTVYLSSVDLNAKELPNSWSTGTGFLFLKDGEPMIGSVNHIDRSTDVLWARLNGERAFHEVQRVRYDGLFDMALFKFKKPKAVKPPGFAILGDADSLRAENDKKLYVFGNPIGWDFLVSEEGRLMREKFYIEDMSAGGLMPIDTTCNPGNSGGPVVDDSGKVVGIVQAIAGLRPICLMIPINHFRAILIMAPGDGPIRHGALGLEAQRAGESGKEANLVIVTKAQSESAGGRAGIRAGDYLLSYIDKGGVERPIESANRFSEEFQLAYRLGDTIRLKTLRGSSVIMRDVLLFNENTHQPARFFDYDRTRTTNMARDKKSL